MPRLSREKRQLLTQAIRDEKSPTEIAKELGVSRSSVYRLISEARASQEAESQQEESGDDIELEVLEYNDEEEDTVENRFYKTSSAFATELELDEETADDTNEAPPVPSRVPPMPRGGGGMPMGLMRKMMEADDAPAMGRVPNRIVEAYDDLDDVFDRGQTIQQIIFNVEHFLPLIRRIVGDVPEQFVQSLTDKSDRELKSTLELIDRTRSVGNLANTFQHTFYTCANGLEIVTSQYLNMKTQGFVNALKAQNNEISMCMKEMAIQEYKRFNKMNDPKVRLGMLALMTLVQIDSTNRLRDAMGSSRQSAPATVQPDLKEKYDDL
jgi:biotin operon repressor